MSARRGGGFALADKADDGGQERFLFTLALKLGKTVGELAHGQPLPLSEHERQRWGQYLAVVAEEEQRAQDKRDEEAKRRSRKGRGGRR